VGGLRTTIALLVAAALLGGAAVVPALEPASPSGVGGQIVDIAAVGAVTCSPDELASDSLPCLGRAMPALMAGANAVFILGDAGGPPRDDPAWVRYLGHTYAVPGTFRGEAQARAYAAAYGARGGQPGIGYYVVRIGQWTVYGLNSNCDQVGGCEPSSAQGRWLADRLRTDAGCSLAIIDRPWRTAVRKVGSSRVADLYAMLREAGVELVLAGHAPYYERFAPQEGMAELVAGTGGRELPSSRDAAADGSAVQFATYGVVRITLFPNRYDGNFLSLGGQLLDGFSGICH
jgi:acid phosphatase type 7